MVASMCSGVEENYPNTVAVKHELGTTAYWKVEVNNMAQDKAVQQRNEHDPNQHSVEAIDDRVADEFLKDFIRDEVRRVRLVAPGTRLTAGSTYVDLRDRRRGELIATGQEVVGVELLVHKKDVDDAIWDKLIASPAG
jgi:hypothetical protein